MRRYWITLISGEYGYLQAAKKPLPGSRVVIWVEDSISEKHKVSGRVSRVND